MSAFASVLAASASSDFNLWHDLGEVVLYGLGAGVGLAIAFGLTMRGFILGTQAQRDGRGAAAAANLTLGVVFGVVCVASIIFALASMLHR